MESLLPYLIPIMVLACPISMGFMMWYMNRSHGKGMGGMNMRPPVKPQADMQPAERDAQVAALQSQLQTLQEQIQSLEAAQSKPEAHQR